MNMYPEYKSVKKCLLEIEEKLNWGSSDSWHNDVFLELSETIQTSTHVLLSPTTLKRVWGKVNYKSAPSISTLNALSQFAGYANWRDFKNKIGTKKTSLPKKKSRSTTGIIMISASIMTIVFISFYSMVGTPGRKAIDSDTSMIKFSSRPVGDGIPNSVVFDFDLGTTVSDSIYIQQFWDPRKTIKINSEQEQATGIYYFPGYFRAKLLVDGQLIKEHDLFIKSQGWLGTIDYEPVPKYISNEKILTSKLSFGPSVLEEIESNEKPIVSSFHLVKDFGDISGDDITIKTSLRNTYREKWAVCQSVRIFILGSKGALIIPFSIPGCVSDIGLMLNNKYFSGKEHDLSAFGTDFSGYRNLEIALKEKEITVFIDENKVYTGKYDDSIGKLVGLRYRFLGAGEVKYLTIKDTEGVTILDESFDLTQ